MKNCYVTLVCWNNEKKQIPWAREGFFFQYELEKMIISLCIWFTIGLVRTFLWSYTPPTQPDTTPLPPNKTEEMSFTCSGDHAQYRIR